MKKRLFYFFTFLALAVRPTFADDTKTNEWGPVNDYYHSQLSISFVGGFHEIKTNQPLNLLISVKNTSANESFTVWVANGWIESSAGFSWAITSPTGKESLLKTGRIGGSGGPITVLPNQVIQSEFNLSSVYKFDEIGTYKIVARRDLRNFGLHSDSVKTDLIISNPLYVPVVPDN